MPEQSSRTQPSAPRLHSADFVCSRGSLPDSSRLPLHGASQTCALGSPDAPVGLYATADPAGRPDAHPSLFDMLDFAGSA